MKPPGVAASATDWNVPVGVARGVFWLPLLGTAALLATPLYYDRLDGEGQWLVRKAFDVAFREDGPVEWGQVLGFAVACFVAGALARRLIEKRRTLPGLLFGTVALGLFVIVGEEISWGQRILGVATPGGLSDVNTQDELNLHNIRGVRSALSYPRMLVAAWGVLAGLLDPRIRRLSTASKVDFPLAPPFFLIPCFAVVLAYDLVRLTLWKKPGFFVSMARYGEWPELCLAAGLAVFLVLAYRPVVRRALSS